MNYRKLGKYGIKVSEVSLGGWLTHGRSLKDETTEDIVKKAFDLGVNFFDTADVYNAGEAE
ncbi:MAG: aldo/keto reductase, partial [Fimbriimonadaceae bacterium]